MGIAIVKQNVMLGSYAPRNDFYSYFMESIDVPSGMVARGNYQVKCVFGDDDSKTGTHGSIEFIFKICKTQELK